MVPGRIYRKSAMKNPIAKNMMAGALLLFLFIALAFSRHIFGLLKFGIQYREFTSIEKRVREVVGPSELQNWAIAELEAHPEDRAFALTNSNFKGVGKLLEVYRQPPVVYSFPSANPSEGFVRIIWRGGRLGVCGIDIGRSNFVSQRSTNQWGDGVYFWFQPD